MTYLHDKQRKMCATASLVAPRFNSDSSRSEDNQVSNPQTVRHSIYFPTTEAEIIDDAGNNYKVSTGILRALAQLLKPVKGLRILLY